MLAVENLDKHEVNSKNDLCFTSLEQFGANVLMSLNRKAIVLTNFQVGATRFLKDLLTAYIQESNNQPREDLDF